VVPIYESEAGWGGRYDSFYYFEHFDDAHEFYINYNKTYNNAPTVPSWYMVAFNPKPL